MNFRRAFEHFSRNVVLRRRLPARVGGARIYVSPDASLRFWRWNMEQTDPRLFDWAEEFVSKGDIVWDIGANLGLFTFSAASRAGRSGHVIAIEADVWLAELLRKSAEQQSNENAPVQILPLAVSDSPGMARFNIASRGRCASHLAESRGSTQSGGVRDSVMVTSVTLDSLLETLPAPRILKIDVEGAEHKVLQGATKLLSTVHPTILCEVSSENTEAVSVLLRSHGYSFFDLDASQPNLNPLALPTFNVLACVSPSTVPVGGFVSLVGTLRDPQTTT